MQRKQDTDGPMVIIYECLPYFAEREESVGLLRHTQVNLVRMHIVDDMCIFKGLIL